LVALTAWPAPADPDPVLGLGEALALLDAFALLEGLAEAELDTDADGLAVGVTAWSAEAGAHWVPTPVHRSTWRNRSCAVLPTVPTTFCAPAPGTDTVMFWLPCCCTSAPVKPAPLTRLSMIEIASFMSPWVGCL
jgi:hypothetical protein